MTKLKKKEKREVIYCSKCNNPIGFTDDKIGGYHMCYDNKKQMKPKKKVCKHSWRFMEKYFDCMGGRYTFYCSKCLNVIYKPI